MTVELQMSRRLLVIGTKSGGHLLCCPPTRGHGTERGVRKRPGRRSRVHAEVRIECFPCRRIQLIRFVVNAAGVTHRSPGASLVRSTNERAALGHSRRA